MSKAKRTQKLAKKTPKPIKKVRRPSEPSKKAISPGMKDMLVGMRLIRDKEHVKMGTRYLSLLFENPKTKKRVRMTFTSPKGEYPPVAFKDVLVGMRLVRVYEFTRFGMKYLSLLFESPKTKKRVRASVSAREKENLPVSIRSVKG